VSVLARVEQLFWGLQTQQFQRFLGLCPKLSGPREASGWAREYDSFLELKMVPYGSPGSSSQKVWQIEKATPPL
jgi:hypothetical protein